MGEKESKLFEMLKTHGPPPEYITPQRVFNILKKLQPFEWAMQATTAISSLFETAVVLDNANYLAAIVFALSLTDAVYGHACRTAAAAAAAAVAVQSKSNGDTKDKDNDNGDGDDKRRISEINNSQRVYKINVGAATTSLRNLLTLARVSPRVQVNWNTVSARCFVQACIDQDLYALIQMPLPPTKTEADTRKGFHLLRSANGILESTQFESSSYPDDGLRWFRLVTEFTLDKERVLACCIHNLRRFFRRTFGGKAFGGKERSESLLLLTTLFL